jgi:inosine-uridine nucleoside N-ribohydrolase
MSARRVLIDTDTGIDDSLALLVALAEPGAEVVGIGPTYGNCASAQAAQNVLYVLEVAGALPVPVARAVPEPLRPERSLTGRHLCTGGTASARWVYTPAA